MNNSWIASARALARQLHKGQIDKAGVDYFEGHPSTVASMGHRRMMRLYDQLLNCIKRNLSPIFIILIFFVFQRHRRMMRLYDQLLNCIKRNLSPIFIILIFFVFQRHILTTLAYIQKHFIAQIVAGWWLIALIIFTFGVIVSKIRHNQSRFSPNWVFTYGLLGIFFYLYYRLYSQDFIFWEFNYGIAYTDLLFTLWGIILLIIAIPRIKNSIYKKAGKTIAQSREKEPFFIDDNSIHWAREDKLGYALLAKRFFEDLQTVNISQGSFSAGIVASWGKGKTSFLNLFRREAEQSGCIVIYFNPRSSRSLEYIQEDFFRVLSEQLAHHHLGFGLIINRYTRALRLLEHNTWVQSILHAVDKLSSSQEKKSVNKAIDAIGKRIYIVIDDLDRLAGDEILEVFKLIDRNGDFHNTVFLTAYDKTYVNNVLGKYLENNIGNDYTDKYFAQELTLPEIDITKLSEFAEKYISDRVKDGEIVSKTRVVEGWRKVRGEIVPHLGSIRHIKRYVNLFLSRYLEVMDDVHCEDFLLVTLLRYKDLPVYNEVSVYDPVSREELISQNTTLISNDNGILNDSILKRLEYISTWEHSKVLLKRLFPDQNNWGSIEHNYCRVRIREHFHLYFQGKRENLYYHKDMLPLLSEINSSDEAIQLLGRIFDLETSRFLLCRFLLYRSYAVVKTATELKRLILLLACATKLTNTPRDLQTALLQMLMKDYALKYIKRGISPDLINYKTSIEDYETSIKDYKTSIEEVLPEVIQRFPDILALTLLSIIKDDDLLKDKYIYTQQGVLDKILLCQKEYYNQYDTESWNFYTAFQISRIIDGIDPKIEESAHMEFAKLARKHPDKFAETLIIEVQTVKEAKLAYIRLKDKVGDYNIFPIGGLDLESWINQFITNKELKHILMIIHRECELTENLGYAVRIPVDDRYTKGNFAYLYEKIREVYSPIPIVVGDFIKTNHEWDEYRADDQYTGKVFRIEHIDAARKEAYLEGIQEVLHMSYIIPIPIKEVAVQLSPEHHSIAQEQGFRFVHELQHWLREEGLNDLRLKV